MGRADVLCPTYSGDFRPMSDIEQLLEFSQSVQITLKLWVLNKKGG